MLIKQATKDDFSALRELELASFETLRSAGAVSGSPTASSDEELQYYCNAELLYAAFDSENIPVGYAGAYIEEGWLHIAEVDVHPKWQRKGIGRRLMATLLDDGRARKLKGATLTTDRFAAFNAPFYTSMGFQLVEKEQCPERLKAILRSEKLLGLDSLRRVAMMIHF
ncbi:GNAT family N-acetyltransferase [Pectobacterium aroidearum]|uniref:GNAT family N-acetyltransferase n=1 Tax=Pectobacterium aroidearum TaxID=1201031 RepID=UPI0032ED2033